MLVREVAAHARQCYAIDVSTEITRTDGWPDNLDLIISDGSSVPVPEGCVDVAYSNQLMEHLHPDDAMQQLRNLYRALRPGGVYICRTPSRHSGPHDISAYFDEVATGFHLLEYGYGDLAALFRDAGFRRLEAFVVVRGRFQRHPLFPVLALEALLRALPQGLAGRLSRTRPTQLMLGVNLVGRK
jgi:SAM-dependent methyltransferase